MALLHRQKLTIILLSFYWPFIFILTHIPIPQLVRKAGVFDKILHFVAFLILVFLLWFSINPYRKVNWRKTTVWWVFLVIAGYALLDEWLQIYSIGRSADLADFLANLTGALAGLFLFTFLTFWPASLIVSGVSIFLLTNLTKANLSLLLPWPDLTFHLLAYGFFTALWIQYIWFYLSLKPPKIKWLIIALAVPGAFLLAAKSFSLISGRSFSRPAFTASIIGIIAIIFTFYVVALLHRWFAQKLPRSDN